MNTSIITKFAGSYSNPDVFEHVLTYVSKKNYIGGCALFYPLTRDSVIKQYYMAEENSLYNTEHRIWHFSVSVSNVRSHRRLILLAEKIATLFASQYQVYYSLELKPGKYHLHFAVNAFSYHPEVQPLTEPIFDQYLEAIRVVLLQEFPTHMPKIIIKEVPNA